MKGEPVDGVTLLAGEIYLLRRKERDQVEVYDVITYCLQRCLTVPDAFGFMSMTSCEYYRCVYIGDCVAECVHRLNVRGTVTRWAVNDNPWGLSVNSAYNVIVTCNTVRKIKEFSSHGDLLRELTIPNDVITPWHAIQTRSGQFIVCHGSSALNDPVHRVCMISADGRHIVHSHGGQSGPDTGQYNVPRYLAVDDDEFILVADVRNHRVTLLSPRLEYIRHAVTRDQLKLEPYFLYLDRQRHLYVAVNKWNNERMIAGRVEVFSV